MALPLQIRTWDSAMRKRIAAFTMIELLVVVAIISILASLLVPSLKRARDTAKSAACVNNLRQLSAAVVLYAGDYNGWVPGDSWMPGDPGRGFSVEYRSWWWVGGSAAYLWNDKRQTQQILSPYVNALSPTWMCPGWPLDYNLLPDGFVGHGVVGSPTVLAAVEMPWPMRNIGYGYRYRVWLRKVDQWGGWETWKLRLSGPAKPSCADLFACLMWDNPPIAPHNNNQRWNVSFLDGTVRSTSGLSEGNWSMLPNIPPDANWANWNP